MNGPYSRFQLRRAFSKKSRQESLGLNFLLHALLVGIFALLSRHSQHSRRHLGDSTCSDSDTDDSDFLFPDLFSRDELRSGAIILHFIGIFYIFIGLAMICDDYFEPCLEVLIRRWNIAPDVAGATFLAVGGSAPEFATAFSGVFFAKSDIGFGTIVGSAVFNIFIGIAVCSLTAPGLILTWWPLTRDTAFYSVTILVLALVISDGWVNIAESAILFGMYFIYVGIMKYNTQLHDFVNAQLAMDIRAPWRLRIRDVVDNIFFQTFVLVFIMLNFVFTAMELIKDDSAEWSEDFNTAAAIIYICEYILKSIAFGFFSYWVDIWNAVDGALVFMVISEWLVNASTQTTAIRIVRFWKGIRLLRSVRVIKAMEQTKHLLATPQSLEQEDTSRSGNGHAEKGTPKRDEMVENLIKSTKDPGQPEPYGGTTSDEEMNSVSANSEMESGREELFDYGESKTDFLWWLLIFPYRFIFHSTIPDVSQPENEKYYIYCFIACISWIIFITYFLVFLATTVGDTFDIPATIMGLTLMAGGTSITDVLSARAAAASGFGDMAVSSTIGSNVFDICICLGFPWLLSTLLVDHGNDIEIESSGLNLMVIGLILTILLTVLFIHYFGWTLNKNLAYTFFALYFVYIAYDLCVEYGWIFGCSD